MQQAGDALDILLRLISRLVSQGRQTLALQRPDVAQWPKNMLNEFVAAGVLRRARPAKVIPCPECTEGNRLEVRREADSVTGNLRLFVVCECDNCLGFISLSAEMLKQWQISRKQIAEALKNGLDLLPTTAKSTSNDFVLGRISGRNGPMLVRVQFDATDTTLAVGSLTRPLGDCLIWRDGRLGLDADLLQVHAESRDNIHDERYQPSTAKREGKKQKTRDRNLDWQRKYRAVKGENPGWSDPSIATMFWDEIGRPERPKPETIRKQMTKKD